MPTYSYRCDECGEQRDVIQSIHSYCEKPDVPLCHGLMSRFISVAPGYNFLAGDRHYDGLRAQDGTDISSRTKHRRYMKEHGLTTEDDFRGEWRRAEKERAEIRTGKMEDKEIRQIVTQKVMEAVAQPD